MSPPDYLTLLFFCSLLDSDSPMETDLSEDQDKIMGWMSADWNWIRRKGPPLRGAGDIDPVIWKYSSLPEDAHEALLWYRLIVRAMHFKVDARDYLQVVGSLWVRAGYEVFGKRLLEEALHLGE